MVSQPLEASFLLRPAVPTTPTLGTDDRRGHCHRRPLSPDFLPSTLPLSSSVQLIFTHRELESLPRRRRLDEDYSSSSSTCSKSANDDAVDDGDAEQGSYCSSELKDNGKDTTCSWHSRTRHIPSSRENAVKLAANTLPLVRNEQEQERDDENNNAPKGQPQHLPYPQPAVVPAAVHPQQQQENRKRRRLVSPLPLLLSSPAARAAQAAQQQQLQQLEQPQQFQTLPQPKPAAIPRTTILPWNKALVEFNAPDWMIQQVTQHTSLSQTITTGTTTNTATTETTTFTNDSSLVALPSAFEPPSDAHYWKRRCFHWQSICQDSRKRIREMEEDQRQLRRRIWELEEQVVWASSAARNNNSSRDGEGVASPPPPAVGVTESGGAPGEHEQQNGAVETVPTLAARGKVLPISPPSDNDATTNKQLRRQQQQSQPPTWIVAVKPRKCSFYLTDCEGLSDSEDYHDNADHENCCDTDADCDSEQGCDHNDDDDEE